MTISSIGSGGGRTYSTLQAWENACVANLVTATDTWEGECYNDSEFTVAGNVLVLAGITTNATYNVQLRCATGQSFRDNANVRTNALAYNASNGVAIRSTSNYTRAIDNSTQYFLADGLQIKTPGGGGGTHPFYNNAVGTVAKNMILDGVRYCYSSDSAANCYLYNSLAVCRGSNDACANVNATGGFVGCTAVAISTGAVAFRTYNYGATLIQNCAGFGFTNFQAGSGGATSGSGANCTDVATAFGSTYGNQVSKTFANQFQSTTTDFRVKAGADLINNGVYNSVIDPDISATARDGTTPTIGCWEYVSAGGSSRPVKMAGYWTGYAGFSGGFAGDD